MDHCESDLDMVLVYVCSKFCRRAAEVPLIAVSKLRCCVSTFWTAVQVVILMFGVRCWVVSTMQTSDIVEGFGQAGT